MSPRGGKKKSPTDDEIREQVKKYKKETGLEDEGVIGRFWRKIDAGRPRIRRITEGDRRRAAERERRGLPPEGPKGGGQQGDGGESRG